MGRDEIEVGMGRGQAARLELPDVLTAVAVEVSRSGRSGLYDVSVTNQRGERVALMRGRSHRVKGRPSVPVEG